MLSHFALLSLPEDRSIEEEFAYMMARQRSRTIAILTVNDYVKLDRKNFVPYRRRAWVNTMALAWLRDKIVLFHTKYD
jgi:hypothetical protein